MAPRKHSWAMLLQPFNALTSMSAHCTDVAQPLAPPNALSLPLTRAHVPAPTQLISLATLPLLDRLPSADVIGMLPTCGPFKLLSGERVHLLGLSLEYPMSLPLVELTRSYSFLGSLKPRVAHVGSISILVRTPRV